MPETTYELRVLISSPGDVADERAQVVAIVDEVNRILRIADTRVHLAIVDWKKDVPSSISGDPQAVVNHFLSAFEFFVGIMWARVGTETPRARSGTIEEFTDAHARKLADDESCEVMFYFKTAQLPLDAIDPDQLKGVRSFKDSISDKGVYKEFSSGEEFRSLLQNDLVRYAHRWNNRFTATADSNRALAPLADVHVVVRDSIQGDDSEIDAIDDEPKTALEYGAEVEEANEVALLAIGRISDATGQLSTQISRRTEEITAANAKSSMRDGRAAVNRAAENLNVWSRDIAANLPSFRDNWSTFIERSGLLFAAVNAGGQSEEELATYRQSIHDMINTLRGSINSTVDFRTSVAGIAPLTREFRRAQTTALRVFDDVLLALSEAESYSLQLLEQIDEGMAH